MLVAQKNIYWLDLAILLLALIITLFGVGSYGLYEPHEGHFAMVAQEMIWRNDWITPHLNGSPYLNKPPLLYWLIASSTNIFGSTEFAARFPVGFTGWLGIIVAWKWARELWGINSSRLAALMLSVTLGWFIFTHQILIDVLLGTLLLSSSYFLWRMLYQPDSWLNYFGAYVSLALCVLTKGLIGIVFPLIGCFILVLIRRDWKIIKRIKLFRGLLVVIAIISPWFIAVERANPEFLHYFIVNEHFNRLLDRRFPPDYEVSKISAVGYLAITACWCFPWMIFLPSVVKSTWKEWRRGLLASASTIERRKSDGALLLAMAAILPVASFLPFASRLIYYSIPAIPPYVILCAGWWDQQSRNLSSVRKSIAIAPSTKSNNFSVGVLTKSSPQSRLIISKNQSINWYAAIALGLGISFYSILVALPFITGLLPATMQTAEVTSLIIIVAIALGTGWLTLGWKMFKGEDQAWIPLVIALIITYLAVVRGFYLYQDIRSSKNLVIGANICLSPDTLWVFEGSREIGTAGSIAYYLNQAKTTDFPPNTYTTIEVLSNGGSNRIPPQFPGNPPEYLITKAELQKSWNSDRPTVFLTDFLRQPDDSNDPVTVNLPQGASEPYLVNGQRRLYLNQAANEIAERQCIKHQMFPKKSDSS